MLPSAFTPNRYLGKRHSAGFSMVETMVAAGLVAVLAGLAAPNFAAMVARFRVEAARDNLVATIQLARTEAIRRGQQVVIRRKIDCPNNDWSCGWSTFEDLNANAVRDANEPILRDTEALGGISLTKNLIPDFFAIDRFGQAAGPVFFSFNIGPTNVASADCVQLAVSFGLRLRSVKGEGACP